jgi:hypothetical protein
MVIQHTPFLFLFCQEGSSATRPADDQRGVRLNGERRKKNPSCVQEGNITEDMQPTALGRSLNRIWAKAALETPEQGQPCGRNSQS